MVFDHRKSFSRFIYFNNSYRFVHVNYYANTIIKVSPTFLDMKKHPELESLSHICDYYSSKFCVLFFFVFCSSWIKFLFAFRRLFRIVTRIKGKLFRHRPAGGACTYAPWKMIFQDTHPTVLHFTHGLRLRTNSTLARYLSCPYNNYGYACFPHGTIILYARLLLYAWRSGSIYTVVIIGVCKWKKNIYVYLYIYLHI